MVCKSLVKAILVPSGDQTGCRDANVAAMPAILAGLSAPSATLALVMPLVATETVGAASDPPMAIDGVRPRRRSVPVPAVLELLAVRDRLCRPCPPLAPGLQRKPLQLAQSARAERSRPWLH